MGPSKMDQQLKIYYLDPVVIMERFLGQPKFAGKIYMKLERQESKQRFLVSGSPAHRHAQHPIAEFIQC